MRTILHYSTMRNLNKVIPNRVSDELYDTIITHLNNHSNDYSLEIKTGFIHLVDACSRGYITPGDCYDAWKLGYCPEHLKLIPSAYAHLL